ncbi:MAG: ISAs1 family transposase [Myxococcales bacterium]|nr:ISAs1 family transposase [Myxococcales bacterium]
MDLRRRAEEPKRRDDVIVITSCFEDMPDPRVERTRLHPLPDIILLTLVGMLAGADDWVHIELFGQANEAWLKTFLELPHGIPSHDTLGRVFRLLDPTEPSARLGRWLDALHERVDDDHVCIDGKSLRRAFDRASGKATMHILNA